MPTDKYILTYDIGTTGNKTCLYRLGEHLEFIDSRISEYPLYMTEKGGAEQVADDWWNAMCQTTRTVLERTKLQPQQISSLAFCCQMQGFVPVDRRGQALRNPMIYLDGRATQQRDRFLDRGLIRIESINLGKLLRSLYITGGIAGTAKDPLWKYHWMRENEPHLYQKLYKWLDVKEYLTMRCTGRFVMTPDSANITFLYDTRPGRRGWSERLCKLFDVHKDHLPEVIAATDIVGGLNGQAAAELGLSPGTPVFGGGGDTSCISLGAGCNSLYDTHIYVGTSGWVISNLNKRKVDVTHFIASILGANPELYHYIAEQETSGLCLKWVCDHLALDEIGVYLTHHESENPDEKYEHLYDLLNKTVAEVPPGAGGVIFTPWLHGNRAPAEDPYSRAMFFNIGLSTGKRDLIRAVLEGVALHKRWMLEAIETKIPRQDTIRFVGGGAKSKIWSQIMADVTGRKIETIERPQDVGAIGAAMICGVGEGIIKSFNDVKKYIPLENSYQPRKEYQDLYDKKFRVFSQLYSKNKSLFHHLNRS
jgi:xylulokinase